MLNYVRRHWRAFLIAATAGVASSVMGVPWLLARAPFRALLNALDPLPSVGVGAGLAVGLLVTWSFAARYLRRYRRTHSLQSPPLQLADFLAAAIIAALGAILSLSQTAIFSTVELSPAGRAFLLLAAIEFSLWLGTAYWVPCRRARPRIAAPAALPAPQRDYSDEPIISDDQDLLGRVQFADQLTREILTLPGPDPFVFGLLGGWGEGKTSVLNLVRNRLAQSPGVLLLSFDPWYFGSEEALVRNFYSGIDRALQAEYVLPSLRHQLVKYQDLLLTGLRSLGLGIELRVTDDPERLRKDIEGWVAQLGKRLVIIIDDLDRLQPPDILGIFKVVKLSANLRNTVFLLSFDPTVTAKLLREATGGDPAFLEKVVQKPVALPRADRSDLDRFLLWSDPTAGYRSAIDRLLDELNIAAQRREEFDKALVPFYVSHMAKLFRTLRQCKRYLNGLRSTLPAIVDEVNLFDAFLLEAIRIFFPELYEDIWQNPWYYLPGWGIPAMLASPFSVAAQPEDKYRAIRDHINDVLKDTPRREIPQEILEEMFFVEVKNAFDQHSRMGHDSRAEEYRAHKRLTHPESFKKYFLFRTPTGELADRQVQDLLASWNAAQIEEAEGQMAETLWQHHQTRQLLDLIRKLHVFLAELDPSRVRPLVRAIYRRAGDWSRSPVGDPWNTEYGRLEELLLAAVNERSAPEDVRGTLTEVVQETVFFPFLVQVILQCHQRGSGRYWRIYERTEPAELRALAAARLQAYFIEGGRNIFEEYSDLDWGFVLYQWGTDWMTHAHSYKPIVQPYILGLIDEKPEYLGRLLSHYVEKAFPGEGLRFRLEDFCHLFDPDETNRSIVDLGARAFASDKERTATDLFRRAYEATQGGA